jgi:hypothetical protein
MRLQDSEDTGNILWTGVRIPDGYTVRLSSGDYPRIRESLLRIRGIEHVKIFSRTEEVAGAVCIQIFYTRGDNLSLFCSHHVLQDKVESVILEYLGSKNKIRNKPNKRNRREKTRITEQGETRR